MRRVVVLSVAMLGLVAAGCGDDGGGLEELVESQVGVPSDSSVGSEDPAGSSAPPTSSAPVEAEDTSVFTLELGQCFDDEVIEGEVQEVPIVPCDQPHDNEVYAIFDLEGGSAYPGDDVVQQQAGEGCLAEFEPFVGLDYQSSVLDASFLSPTEQGWVELGDREVVCYVFRVDLQKVTGTLRGTAQ
jgi:hypothetical protein